MSDIWLAHHGIKGQKWGVRRFQNKDGSLTAAGKKRYGEDSPNRQLKKKYAKTRDELDSAWKQRSDEYSSLDEAKMKELDERSQKISGMDYWDAWDAAEKEYLKDRENFKYEGSLYEKMNQLDEDTYDKYKEKEDEIKIRYDDKFREIGEQFVDEYMNTKKVSKITFDDLSKMYKKQYNHEHQEYYEDWSVNLIFDYVDGPNSKYEFGWDEDGNPCIIKKKT